jgi:glycerol uptake facilitator-like aquaporin
MNKYLAELAGTFLLTAAVIISLAGKFPVPTPIVAAVTLGVCVYVFGALSGTHINPAITLGIYSVGKISLKDALSYLVAQFVGAGLAIIVTRTLVVAATVTANNTTPVIIGEILGTFCLASGVASVVFGKAPSPAAGLTIGGALLLGISLASSGSNGVLNPAVAVGIGSVSLAYLTAPIIGSLIAFQLYRFLAADREIPKAVSEAESRAQAVGKAAGAN